MLSTPFSFSEFYYAQGSEESQFISEVYRIQAIFFWIESTPLIVYLMSSQLFSVIFLNAEGILRPRKAQTATP